MELDLKMDQIEEKIIEAIQYYKHSKNERPTSEEILKYVKNTGNTKLEFSMFKNAMRELKLRKEICNEMQNGKFTYFIPRTPEITLKVKKSEKQLKRNVTLPTFPLEKYHKITSQTVDCYKDPKTEIVQHKNVEQKVLVVSNNDTFEYYAEEDEEECNDVGRLEKFIDHMMDRLDDFIMSKDPDGNILSFYEQRIFDLKSEVLFLRKLTTSNNTLLLDEVRFLRNELDSKNNIIKQLTNQVSKTEMQYEIEYTKKSTEDLGSLERITNKSMAFLKDCEKGLLKESTIDQINEPWLKDVPNNWLGKDCSPYSDGFMSSDILEKVKTGISLRHKDMSPCIGGDNTMQSIDIAKIFGNFFGFMVDTPLEALSSAVVISKLGKDQIVPGMETVVTSVQDIKSDEISEEANNVDHVENMSYKVEKDMQNYQGWLSLNIMDTFQATTDAWDGNKSNVTANEVNLLAICENMSEKVNNINLKLRTFCDQKNIDYDQKIEEPCLNLDKLSLGTNKNNLLTNAYISRSLTT